jgi:hypothetical protein
MTILRYPIRLIAITLLMSGSALAYGYGPVENGRAVFRPRALMTQAEITEYRRALKAAPTMEARQQIRAAMQIELRERALERGLTLSEPNPQTLGMRWSEINREGPVREPALMAPHAP